MSDRTLEELFSDARHALEDHDDLQEAEPAFQKFVIAARAPAADRRVVVECLVQAIEGQRLPLELVQYCFHALRWPEFAALIESLREGWTADMRRRQLWCHMRDALEPNWEDAEFFASFR